MTTNDFIGKVCPYCKSPFKEGDDIVICSVCEMPHHKDCWVDNQGCTTFGCSGTIKSPSDAPSDDMPFEIELYDEQEPIEKKSTNTANYRFCTKCGAQNFSTSAFCCRCGSPLSQIPERQQTPPKYSTDTAGNNPYSYGQPGYYPNSGNNGYGTQYAAFSSDSQTNLEMLIGKNAEYYMPKFNDMKARNTKSSWNWCAFLFAPYWMIYRKMYGYGVAVLGGILLLSVIGGVFLSLVSLAAYIVFGIVGNYVYMQTLEKKVLQMDMLTGSYKTEYVNKNGGTNTTATVLAIIGYAILLTIIQYA